MKRPFVSTDENELSVTSTELLRQARASDQAAWRELVTLYSRRIYRWSRRAGLQPADASNTVQEVLEAVARKLGDFRRDRPGDTFRGWLRRITDNKVRDHFRREGRSLEVAPGGDDAHELMNAIPQPQETIGDREEAQTGDPPAINKQVLIAIDEVREQVSPRDWKVFWRVAVDGQSAGEAGAEFGLTANAVRLVKMRVLRKLRTKTCELTSSDAQA